MSSAVLSSQWLWMDSSSRKLHNNDISRAGAHLSPHLALLYRCNLHWGHVLCCDPIKSRMTVRYLGLSVSKQLCRLRHSLDLFMGTKKNWKKQASTKRWFTWLKKTILWNQNLSHRCSDPSTAQYIELNNLQANSLRQFSVSEMLVSWLN